VVPIVDEELTRPGIADSSPNCQGERGYLFRVVGVLGTKAPGFEIRYVSSNRACDGRVGGGWPEEGNNRWGGEVSIGFERAEEEGVV
jgi:hypothetical protein